MTSTEKYNYIFENQNDYYVANRFGWFESLLSDIRTLIEGGKRLKNAPSAELGGNFGAGNVSIAILVCIGLELVQHFIVEQQKRRMVVITQMKM